MAQNTPAGWFPDPDQPGQARWWDGNAWTEHRQPAPPQAAPRLQHTPLLQPARQGKPWWRATWAVSMAAFIVGLVIAAAASGSGGSTAATASGSGPTVTVTAEADSATTATVTAHPTATRTIKVKIPPPPPKKVIDGDGTWVVGQDIKPGTYRNSDGGECYWARLKGLTGDFSELLANGNTAGQAVVTIKPTDKGFQTERCGSWSRVG